MLGTAFAAYTAAQLVRPSSQRNQGSPGGLLGRNAGGFSASQRRHPGAVDLPIRPTTRPNSFHLPRRQLHLRALLNWSPRPKHLLMGGDKIRMGWAAPNAGWFGFCGKVEVDESRNEIFAWSSIAPRAIPTGPASRLPLVLSFVQC
jgi:hypothetical protein